MDITHMPLVPSFLLDCFFSPWTVIFVSILVTWQVIVQPVGLQEDIL
jgi:hypothetical protein